MVPDLFLDLARSLERACFDYVLIEDSSYIGESYGGSTAIYLENAIAVPRQDPAIIAALMTQVTSRNSAVNPHVTGIPRGAAPRRLVLAQEVILNERITTGPEGQTQILFIDQSTMTDWLLVAYGS
jgi:hypothetical protein